MGWRVNVLAFCVVFLLVAMPVPLPAEPLFPLETLSPSTPPPGVHRVRLGVRYNDGERLPFQETDRNRKVYHLPEVNATLGISPNMEVLVGYPFLYLKQEGQGWEYGSGDLRLGWIYRLAEEGPLVPETALHFAVKLPNADELKEFGTNETDFFAGGLFAKRWGEITLLGNADSAILGNPRGENPNQDDVLFYKIGVLYPLFPGTIAGLEVEGGEFSRFGNDRLFLRGGISWLWREMILDVGAAAGLTEASGDFQLRAGVSLPFGHERKYVPPLYR